MFGQRTLITFFLIVLASWHLGVLAFSQTFDASKLLADLDAPDYATRQAATQTLLLAADVPEATWVELFAHARSPEQRHRLLVAARHHTLVALRRKEFPERGPGSLGMTQRVITPNERRQLGGRPGVLVNSTFPGFPAFAHLQPGDLIVAINATPIDKGTSKDGFMQLVQLTDAGQTVTLTILRDGRELTRQITLASFEALTRMYERPDLGPTVRFESQWRRTRDQLLGYSADARPVTIELLQ